VAGFAITSLSSRSEFHYSEPMIAEITIVRSEQTPLPLVIGWILFVVVAIMYWRSGSRK